MYISKEALGAFSLSPLDLLCRKELAISINKEINQANVNRDVIVIKQLTDTFGLNIYIKCYADHSLLRGGQIYDSLEDHS